MTPLRALSGREVVKALSRLGFEVVRIRGSHHFMRHADGRVTVVPVHARETIGSGLMAKIARDAEVTREQLEDQL